MIWMMEKTPNGEEKTVFADLTRRYSVIATNGLLDLAFHPKFRASRKYYLFYQVFEEGNHHAYRRGKRSRRISRAIRPPRVLC